MLKNANRPEFFPEVGFAFKIGQVSAEKLLNYRIVHPSIKFKPNPDIEYSMPIAFAYHCTAMRDRVATGFRQIFYDSTRNSSAKRYSESLLRHLCQVFGSTDDILVALSHFDPLGLGLPFGWSFVDRVKKSALQECILNRIGVAPEGVTNKTPVNYKIVVPPVALGVFAYVLLGDHPIKFHYLNMKNGQLKFTLGIIAENQIFSEKSFSDGPWPLPELLDRPSLLIRDSTLQLLRIANSTDALIELEVTQL